MRYYQQEADAAIAECTDNRCVVKMFCGTGKSKIMSEGRFLAGAKLVVYVFPSLALIDQFTRQYLGDVDAAHLLCVSSEAGATTTPETIQRFFTCNEFTRDTTLTATEPQRRIVCVTYQSMHTLFENMGETVVDVCCYDEAHHVVAPTYQSLVFSNPAIRKKVFFTATPVNENGVVMYDPDFSRDSDLVESSDKLTCGPLVYEYNCVDEGYLNPFDVRVDSLMASAVDNESFFETDTTASSTLAGKMYEVRARGYRQRVGGTTGAENHVGRTAVAQDVPVIAPRRWVAGGGEERRRRLFKFCELMGYDEFLPCFTPLKGQDKLSDMDRIWEKIYLELN
jgi:predicted helicase